MEDFAGSISSASLGIMGVGVERTVCHNLHEGGVDLLPRRLGEIDRQRANTVTVRGKFGGEVARGAGRGGCPRPAPSLVYKTAGGGR
jgi:hypothetical protein